MARTDTDQLVIKLEARVRDFERSMQKASRTGEKQFNKIKRDAKDTGRSVEQSLLAIGQRVNGALSKLGIGGAISGLVSGGIVAALGDAAKGIAEIGDNARQAGLDAKSFQEIAYVARQNRIEVDSLTAGIREMQLRLDEFIQSGGKSGSAAASLQRLGFTVDELKQKLKDPISLFEEIIRRVRQLDRAAQIRVFDEIFGGDGERFVRLIDQGADGIRDTIDEAHRLGVVLDDDVIAKAAELDRKFNAIADTVSTNLKSAIVEAADALSDFVDGFRDFENQRAETLQSEQADVDRKRLDIENQILERKAAQGDLIGVQADANKKAIGALEQQLDTLGQKSSKIANVLSGRTKPASTPTEITVHPHKPPSTGSGSSSSASATKNETDRVRELIAELDHEHALIGKTELEKEKMNALRRAGASATAQEKAIIESKVEAIYAEEQAQKKLKDAQEALAKAGGFAADAIGAALEGVANGSLTAAEAVKQLAVQLAIAAAKGALLNQGPLAGLFGGGLFGGGQSVDPWAGLRTVVPGFAAGTNYAPGGLAVVGEKGPELVNLPRGSKVTPNNMTMPSLHTTAGASAKDVHVTVGVSVDDDGKIQAYVKDQSVRITKAGLGEYDKHLNQTFGARMRRTQQRRL